MPEQVKNPGTAVVMDGREWIVPALGVMDFRRNVNLLMTRPVVDEKDPATFEALGKHLDAVFPVLYLAFKRNYPEVTEEVFISMLDMRSYGEVTEAVLAASGVTKGKPGEV
jgi:hypothetical protein